MPTPNLPVGLATREATHTLPPQLREVRLLQNTFEPEARTIECVWTAGATVRRFNWWREEYYDEVLEVSEQAVDLSRLNSGACAVLNSHGTWDLSDQIGVVERAWIKDGQGHALLRLSGRAEIAGIVEDIASGIIRNISVGYSVQKYEITREEGKVAEYRAVEWTPHEISFVPVPADAAAATRNQQSAQGTPCVYVSTHTQESSMPNAAQSRAADTAATVPTAPTPAPAPSTTANDAPAADAGDANARAADIAELAARHGMSDRTAEWLRGGQTVDQVRTLILNELAARDEAAGGHVNRSAITHFRDEVDLRGDAFARSLLARGRVVDPTTSRVFVVSGDNPMRGLTLMDVARNCLERIGVRTLGMDKRELVGRAFTQSGSDFPILLENAMHKALQAAYAVAPDTWSRWCKKGTVSDFRAHNRYRVGSLGNLDSLTELGEFRNKTIPDGEKASITAATKGNIINISRQAIINDDLDSFIGLAVMLGRAAKRTVEADAYAYLASNPTMADGFALFSTEHANTEAAAAPSVTTIDAGRQKMAKQKDVSGNDYLDLRPAVWLGPLSYGGAARVANNDQYDPDASNKLQRSNIVKGLFRDVVDTPRIADSKWYMFADPDEAPVIEVAFLDGIEEPFLDQEEGFTVDGARYKARLDFGIAAIDYRGALRNG